MVKRVPIGIALGGIVTAALFYLMQALIYTDDSALNEAPAISLVDFVRIQEEAEVERKQRKPKPPPDIDEPPPDIPNINLNTEVNSIGIDVGQPQFDNQIDIQSQGDFSSDGEYLPIVKVAPNYPRRAQARGIEGYVLLEFTVTKTGAVENPVIVESDPPGIFDRAAIQAALKFKYKPKVVNGEGIDVPGVQNRITFQLNDEGRR